MRTHYCRIKIVEGAGEKCDVSPDTISDLKKVLEFVEKHSDLQGLATRPIKALMSIPDPEIQEKAILHVEKTLNRKTPTGGKYKKRLTEPEVENIIKKVSPPVPEPEKPKPVNTAGNHQPGDLVESGLPPQQPLSVVMKAVDPIKAKSALMEELAEELLALYPQNFQTTVTDIIRAHNTPTSKYGVKDAFYYGIQALAEKKKP